MNNILPEIEEALQIKLIELEQDEPFHTNSYRCNSSGIIHELCLSNLHFEHFAALKPIFKTLKTLKLVNCVVRDAWAFHELGKLDNLFLERTSVTIDSEIKQRSDFYLHRLELSEMSMSSFNTLTSAFYLVQDLRIKDCQLNSIKCFLQFDFINILHLDSVSFSEEDAYDSNTPLANTIHRHFQSLYLENMVVNHPAYYLPLAKHLEYVHFTKCKVSNLYEVNLLPYLYSLTINHSDYIGSGNEKFYAPAEERRFNFLNLENMKLPGFDFFIPISKGLYILYIYNCEVKSLQSISKFPDLGELRIHPLVKVEDHTPFPSEGSSFALETCIIGPRSTYDWEEVELHPEFDAEHLATIAPWVKQLKIGGYKLINTDILKHFSQLEEIAFEKGNLDLNDFVIVAPQITSLVFEQTAIKHQEAFQYFTRLEKLEVFSYDDDIGQIDLRNLLPLKDSLKRFDVSYSLIQNIQALGQFTALEEIETSVSSIELAQAILSIPSLQKLELNIFDVAPSITETVFLDLQKLTNVQNLTLSADKGIRFKGIGHLKALKTLDLSFDCDLENLGNLENLEKLVICGDDAYQVPCLENLKILELNMGENCKLESLKNFPNIEQLQLVIAWNEKIDFGGLEQLKRLVLDYNNMESYITFENLPKLEALSLERNEDIDLAKLACLSNLKVLNLEECTIQSLEGIEHLKNLEQLNLYDNKISDIRLLNSLAYLKEVNLSGNPIEKQEAEEQLDKPEIAIWLSRPHIPFRIRID